MWNRKLQLVVVSHSAPQRSPKRDNSWSLSCRLWVEDRRVLCHCLRLELVSAATGGDSLRPGLDVPPHFCGRFQTVESGKGLRVPV